MRGATCCKNDNEVITEEIAYAIVVDFPLLRFYSDARYAVNARRRLNRQAEIAEAVELMGSTGSASKEPVIEEIMTNIENGSGPPSCFSPRLLLRLATRPRKVTSGTIGVSVSLRRALQVSMQKPISIAQRARHLRAFAKYERRQ